MAGIMWLLFICLCPGGTGPEIQPQKRTFYLSLTCWYRPGHLSPHRKQVFVVCADDGFWNCLGQYDGRALPDGGGPNPAGKIWRVHGHHQHDDRYTDDFTKPDFWFHPEKHTEQ